MSSRTYQLAEKYNATSFLLLFPPNLDSVGKPVVFGLVRIFGPKSSVAQLVAMVVDVVAAVRWRLVSEKRGAGLVGISTVNDVSRILYGTISTGK